MIIPVKCFTCGKVLADKYDWYIIEVEKLKASMKTAPDAFEAVKTKPILDKLGLTRICCRRHMISQVDMMAVI